MSSGKSALDARTAALTGLSKAQVSEITKAFVQAIREEIIDNGTVFVDGLGRFNLNKHEPKGVSLPVGGRVMPVHTRYRISFSMVEKLKNEVKDVHGGWHGKVRSRRVNKGPGSGKRG